MIGTPITLTAGDPNDGTMARRVFFEADLDGGGGGANEYLAAIEHCAGISKHINPGTTCSGDNDPACLNILNGRRPNHNVRGASS